MPVQRTRGFKRRRRNGGRNLRTNIRYRKSAGAQSSQLSRMANICLRNSRILNRQKTWSDFTWGFTETLPQNVWYAFPLIDPLLWQPTMRQNANTREASNTYVRNVKIRYSVRSPDSPVRCTWTIYLAQLQTIAADWEPAGAPLTNALRPDLDYTVMGPGNSPQLNPNTWKVIARGTKTTYPLAVAGAQLGNPSTTQMRGAMDRQVGLTLRTLPLQGGQGTFWKNMTSDEVPYMKQLWILAYPEIDSGAGGPYNAGIDLQALFTCVNSD